MSEALSTSLPLDFPPLLALAEANVRANWPIEERTRTRFGYDPRGDTLDDYCAEIRAFFIGCEADRLRDLTRRESQAVWLGWLARELWRKVGGNRAEPQGTALWEEERCDGLHYIVRWAYGRMNGSYRVSYACSIPGGDPCGRDDLRCPTLPNPDAPDAPIRALRAAVLTVGSRGGA